MLIPGGQDTAYARPASGNADQGCRDAQKHNIAQQHLIEVGQWLACFAKYDF